MNTQHRLLLFRQLAVLLGSGLSVRRSVELVGAAGSPAVRHCLQDVEMQLMQGQPLSVAIARHPHYFDAWTTSLLKLAEYSGTLVATCEQLVAEAERQLQYQQLWRSLVMSGFAVMISVLWVMTIAIQRPGLTQLQPWLGLILVTMGGVGLMWALSSYASERAVTSMVRMIPGTKPLREAQTVLYLAELALPLAAGASLGAALDLLRMHVPHATLRKTLAIAAHHVKQGHPLSHSLQNRIPDKAIQLIRTGEETGDLATMLRSLADHYVCEIDVQVRWLQAILMPIATLAVASIVLTLGIHVIRGVTAGFPE